MTDHMSYFPTLLNLGIAAYCNQQSRRLLTVISSLGDSVISNQRTHCVELYRPYTTWQTGKSSPMAADLLLNSFLVSNS